MDIERDVSNPIFSLNLMELQKHILVNRKDSIVYVAVVKSGLSAAIIPQTYIFPEFI